MSGNESGKFVSQVRRALINYLTKALALFYFVSCLYISMHNAKLRVVTHKPATFPFSGDGQEARFKALHGDPQLERHRIPLTYITLCKKKMFLFLTVS